MMEVSDTSAMLKLERHEHPTEYVLFVNAETDP